ncbi:UNVERIFIED_CONTAM: hypothetical protein RMT77_008004 [Armadillidium vulgare]
MTLFVIMDNLFGRIEFSFDVKNEKSKLGWKICESSVERVPILYKKVEMAPIIFPENKAQEFEYVQQLQQLQLLAKLQTEYFQDSFKWNKSIQKLHEFL